MPQENTAPKEAPKVPDEGLSTQKSLDSVKLPNEEGPDAILGDPEGILDMEGFEGTEYEHTTEPGDLPRQEEPPAPVKTPKPADLKPDDSKSGDDDLGSEPGVIDTEIAHKALQEEKAKKPEEQPVEPTVLPPHADDKGRDYSGFDPADVPALKAMPNAAFNYFKNRLPALAKAKEEAEQKFKSVLETGGIPENYLEHPEAYAFVPEYKKQQDELLYVDAEEQFAKKQLDAIRNGADVYNRADTWTEDGKLTTKAFKVTDENRQHIEDELVTLIGNLAKDRGDITKRAQEIEQEFKAKQSTVVETVREAEKKYYPFYEEGQPTFTPELQKDLNVFVSGLPVALQGSPLAVPLGKSFLLIKEMNSLLKSYKDKIGQISPGQQQQQQTKPQVPGERREEPSSREQTASGGGAQVDEFNDSEWESDMDPV